MKILTFLKKNAANFISILRAVIAFQLLSVEPFSKYFFIIFAVCGITDVLDGIVARCLNTESRIGAQIDGGADMIFAIVSLVKIIPAIDLHRWAYIWVLIIAAIRLVNLILGIIKKKRVVVIHSIANRITALMLFALPFGYIFIDVNYVAGCVCSMATLAALQDTITILSGRNHRRLNKGIAEAVAVLGSTAILTIVIMLYVANGEGRPEFSFEVLKEESHKVMYQSNRCMYNADVIEKVDDYRDLVTEYCEKYGISEYADLALAMIMQESTGNPPDVMQTEQSYYNDEPPIDSVDESVNCGVHQLADCLEKAGVLGPDDMTRIPLAIQGYNYGNGYISWALDRDLGYTEENAAYFSQMMKERHGYKIYGDPEYAQHVLRYYSKQSVVDLEIKDET